MLTLGHSLTLAMALSISGDAAPMAPPPALHDVQRQLRMSRPPRQRHMLRVAIPAKATALALPRIDGPADGNRPLILIDPGHGGHDPGAISPATGRSEKALTLAIARVIRAELLRTGRFRVALTRDDDRFLALQERSGLARALGAALFLSLHADAAENPQARGGSIYTLSEVASDREAARLAARENRADAIGGVRLSDASDSVSAILIDLSLRETMVKSAAFAAILQREAGAAMRLRADAPRQASLIVLKSPDVPSVLLETAYISNVDDEAQLASRAGQQAIATVVRRAIEIYFAREQARANDQ